MLRFPSPKTSKATCQQLENRWRKTPHVNTKGQMEVLLVSLTLLCLGIQAYHYIGYPALLFLVARFRPRPVTQRPYVPTVSLVIAAYNEASVIGDKLANSLAIDYPELEIIVVSDGSSDETPLVVEQFARDSVIGLFQPERRGKSHAINRAAAEAKGEILIFSDANAFYLPDAIRKLTRNFADPTVSLVTGKRTIRRKGCAGQLSAGVESEGFYWRYESFLKSLESRIASTAGVVGEMLAIRRAVFAPITAGIINDDSWLALHTLRQGQRAIYEPEAGCWELPSPNMAVDSERRDRMTAGRYQLMLNLGNWPWRSPMAVFMLFSHKFLRLLLPFFMTGALVGNIALITYPPLHLFFQLTLAAQVIFYGLALLGYVGQAVGRTWKIPNIAYFIANGNFRSLRGLMRHLTGRQSVVWVKPSR